MWGFLGRFVACLMCWVHFKLTLLLQEWVWCWHVWVGCGCEVIVKIRVSLKIEWELHEDSNLPILSVSRVDLSFENLCLVELPYTWFHESRWSLFGWGTLSRVSWGYKHKSSIPSFILPLESGINGGEILACSTGNGESGNQLSGVDVTLGTTKWLWW